MVTILSIGPTLHYPITSNCLTLNPFHFIILLSGRRWMSYKAKGAIALLRGGAGFYSNIFVVPKHSDDLGPMLNLRQLSGSMHVATF